MIAIDDLEFLYPHGDFTLNIPRLRVAKKEKIAFIGPSGCGKTTLLNLVAGIVIPNGGCLQVGETELSRLCAGERRQWRITTIGFTFQNFELVEYLNVLDNILHPYRISPALDLTPEVRQRAADLAEAMGIGGKLRRRVAHLSQGEKQRAAICRAMLPRPQLILADEPTGNLDPNNKTKILNLLFQQAEDHGATLLAVTHDHELLERFDRVVDFRNLKNRA